MADRDAFGNKIDDDSLAGMGWSIGGDATAPSMPQDSPTPTPAPTPPPAPRPATPAPAMSAGTAPPPAPAMPSIFTPPPAAQRALGSAGIPMPTAARTPGGMRGVRVFTRLVSMVVALAIVGGIVLAIVGTVDSVKDKVTSVTDSFTTPSFSTPGSSTPTESTPTKPAKPPTGLQRGSMMRADAFAKALVKLRAQGGRAQTLRVDAERVSGNVLSKTGRMSVVSLSWDGTSQVVRTGAHIPSASAVSLGAVTAKAPTRVVARAAAALGRPARKVNYLVLTSFAGKAQWYVYFKDGKYLSASLDGRRVTRIN
jgi:hypothetical protein